MVEKARSTGVGHTLRCGQCLVSLIVVGACVMVATAQPNRGQQPVSVQNPGPVEPLPQKPRPIDAPPPAPEPLLGPDRFRLPLLPLDSAPRLDAVPRPSGEVEKEYARFIGPRIDPRNTLDLVLGRPTILQLKEKPERIQLPDENIVAQELITPQELSLSGKAPGTTVLNLWFKDPADPKREIILSYLVRVTAPTDTRNLREQLDQVYRALEQEINKAFPDSVVRLSLVGDRLVLSGQAKDTPEAETILRLVQANAPGQRARVPGQTNLLINLTGAELGPDGVPDGALERLLAGTPPNVINLLRIPGEQQVLLRVTVAEVSRTAARSIGINFTLSNRQGLAVLGQQTGNIAGNAAGGGGASGLGGIASSTNNLPMILDNGRIIAAVNALRNMNLARSLAEPTLVALNNQTASFQAGGTFPVPVTTGATLNGLQGVQFVPFGVELSFTPHITDGDRIRLDVTANVSTRNVQTGANIGGANVPGTDTRNFRTMVEMRAGQTMAVAGLMRTDFGADATRVPFFGDLPIIGRLAAFDRTAAGEQELVILVTPVLAHPLDARDCRPLPGADIFEPGDIEFYLLGRLESRRPYDYRSPVMTDIHRMIRYRKCEQSFIFGPQGHCEIKP